MGAATPPGVRLPSWLRCATMPPMESFGAWLSGQLRQRGLSTRAVAARSGEDDEGNPLISHGTVAKYASGARQPHALTQQVITGLARALDLPESEIRRRAGMPQPVPEWRPPREAHTLSREDRQLVEGLIRRLAAAATHASNGSVEITELEGDSTTTRRAASDRPLSDQDKAKLDAMMDAHRPGVRRRAVNDW